MHRFELTPNCSLSKRQAVVFFGGIAAISLSVAGTFAAAGYWPILPFAGLELAALGGALYCSQRQGRRREYICVDDRLVTVLRSTGRAEERVELPRPWTRVDLRPAPCSNWPTRLELAAMGRRVEIGAFLTDGEREGLGARLREVLRQANAMTPLDLTRTD